MTIPVADWTVVVTGTSELLTCDPFMWNTSELDPGKYLIRLRAWELDGSMNQEIVCANVKTDTTPPQNVSLAIAEGHCTPKRLIHLLLEGGDATEMRIFGDVAPSDWIPYAVTATARIKGLSGMKQVKAEFKDAAGNVSAPASAWIYFYVDLKAPELHVVPYPITVERPNPVVIRVFSNEALQGNPDVTVKQVFNPAIGVSMVNEGAPYPYQWIGDVDTAPMRLGFASLNAKARDLVGNKGTASSWFFVLGFPED
jgi:hypothetical protein